MNVRFWTALVALSTVAAPAAAQDLDPLSSGATEPLVLEEMPSVVGASRWRQSLDDAPADVSVITAAEIRRFGYRTIDEALANVRGLYVSNDRNYGYVGVRGLSRPGDFNSRILVLVNGHAMNDAPYLSSLLGREFLIDLAIVERIEIVRGPVSSLYGTNAVLAVINVVTRTAPSAAHLEGAGVEMSAEGDSLRRGKVRATFDRFVFDSARVFASASYEHGMGQRFDYPELADLGQAPTERKSDRLDAINSFGTFSWGPFTLQAALNRYRKNVPTASYGVMPDSGESTVDYRGFVEAALALSPVPDLGINGRVYLDHSHYSGRYPYTAEDGGEYRDSGKGTWLGAEVLADVERFRPLRITAGASLQGYLDVTQTAEQPAADYTLEDRHSFAAWALFGNGELELLSRRLRLIGGVRHDDFATFGARTSPRLAVVATPVPGTTVKAIYGEAFRAPNIFELYYDEFPEERSGQEPNPGLAPEVIRHMEIDVQQEIASGRGRFGMGFFHYRVKDLISLLPDDLEETERYENVEQVRALGAELEASASLGWRELRMTGAYTYVRAVDLSTGDRLSNSPEHLAQARASMAIWPNLFYAAVAVRYIGERPGLPGRADAPAAVTADVTITVDEPVPGMFVGIGATNLFDVRWTVPGGPEHVQELIPQDGRSIWASLSYSF